MRFFVTFGSSLSFSTILSRASCIALLLTALPSLADVSSFLHLDRGHLFTVQGSNTVGARLAPSWAKAYLSAKGAEGVQIEALGQENEYRVKGRNGNHAVYIDIHAHGSSTGFRGLKASTANLAMSSRPIKGKEVISLQSLGDMKGARAEHVVAIDGLAVIVHPLNAASELSVDQVAQIFSGKITHWKELGGANRPISLYARDNNSGTFDTFKSLVLRKKYRLSPIAKRFESNDELSEQVANDVYGIGFVGLASVNQSKAVAISDSGTDALRPEMIFVATEDYPLSRRLFMYSPPSVDNAYVDEFIEFAQSLPGQELVEAIGFVSQNPKELKIDLDSGPKQYQILAQLAERLSVNFRFQPGQADLDNKALKDVERLASYIKANNRPSFSIQLVGFSNEESTGHRARVLSRLRATAVKSALYRYGIRTESVIGFGDSLRVANADGSSAIKNERVEAWVLPSEKAAELHRFSPINDSVAGRN